METRRRALRKTANDSEHSAYSDVVNEREKKAKHSWFAVLAKRCFYGTFIGSVLFVACCATWAAFWSPTSVNPVNYRLPPFTKFDKAAIKADYKLADAVRLLPEDLMAPESIVVQEDRIYTSTADGYVVEIVNEKISQTINIGNETCEKKMDVKNCGRPLGMREIGPRKLMVADAYYGLCEVDFNDDSVTQLIPAETELDGKPIIFYNDLDIVDDVVYFTHSSCRWNVDQYVYILLSGIADGRLIRYNRTSGELALILDNLFFPNGVQISEDRKYLYVAETGMARILRLKMSEIENTEVEYLIDNLPCLPDNIRLSDTGNLWIPCAAVRTFGSLSFQGFRQIPQYDWLGQHPEIRKFMIKFIPQRALFHLMHALGSHYGLALLVDNSGRYVRSLHDDAGKTVTEISQVSENGTHLLFGTYSSSGISCLPIM